MTMTVEIENVAQSYAVVSALLSKRKWEHEHEIETQVEAIDEILEQFEGTSTRTLLEQDENYEVGR